MVGLRLLILTIKDRLIATKLTNFPTSSVLSKPSEGMYLEHVISPFHRNAFSKLRFSIIPSAFIEDL